MILGNHFLALPLALASCRAIYLGLSHPHSVGPSLTPSDRKLEKSLSFQDIFSKIGGHLLLDLSHRLAKMKCKFFACVSVSWFICSLKNGKVGYFASFSRYLYQNWWTSSH